MPRKKGLPKTGGRVKGTPNKATAELRKIVIDILFTRIPNLSNLLDRIGKDNPSKEADILLRLIDLALPKLVAEQVEKQESISDFCNSVRNQIYDSFK